MKITDASQFDRLFKALALELTYANVHDNMFLKVNASITEYQYEVNQAPAFWGITRDAIKDVATLGICRVYDSDHRTNSLPNLLIEMRDNPAFLEIVLGKNARADVVDSKQLADDIEFASEKNPAVYRLIRWRSDIFVHKNARRVANDKPLHREHVPKYEDLELLLKHGMKIINRYAGELRSTEYATFFSGEEDHKAVLDAVRHSLQIKRNDYADEIRRMGYDPKAFGL